MFKATRVAIIMIILLVLFIVANDIINFLGLERATDWSLTVLTWILDIFEYILDLFLEGMKNFLTKS